MAQTVSGGRGEEPESRIHKLSNKLVVEDVVVIERKREIEVPEVRFTPVFYEKPVITEKHIETIKYNVKEESTTRYNVIEESTTKYIPQEIICEKPIVKEKSITYEKPILVEKIYEKPVIVEKKYEVSDVKNLDEVKTYLQAVKDLAASLSELKAQLDSLKKYVLMEEIVRVPRIEYFPVKVERIVWQDVPRERMAQNANGIS